jgi:glyoxylase-like metal-dependent hydrolase (beta-lactamase superfamily II)
MGWSTTVISPPDGDMGAYYASLDKVMSRGFGVLWPTHGPPVLDVPPFLQAYKDHRLDREAQILSELAQGRTRIKAMVASMYASVDPRLHPAAAHSVLAHLIHLVRTGQVVADGEVGVEADFALARS